MLTTDEKKIFNLCIPHLGETPIIFDVGAYKGAYADYVLLKLPRAECLLFEPDAELCDYLMYKGYRNFYVVAVSSFVGEKDFYRVDGTELSSLYDRPVFNDLPKSVKRVPTITIDFFCNDCGETKKDIDFLKIDVEGAELDVLHGCQKMLSEKRIKFLQVEYGGTYPDAGITFKQVIEYVSGFGYKVYELKADKLVEVTRENFIEDYRFANFLISKIELC